MRYRIDPRQSQVVVTARSSVHDTSATWDKVSGWIDATPGDVADGTASAQVTVDMDSFDAGDFLKNRKIRKDLDVKNHPAATFQLEGLSGVAQSDDGVAATASGAISWHGRKAAISAAGKATIDSSSIVADASFELDIRDLGVKAPKILMLKVDDIVSIKVRLTAKAE